MALRLEEPFETWDLVKVLQRDPGRPKLHYKTVATHLQALVERGYLVREAGGSGGPGGQHRYRLAMAASELATSYIDRFLDLLGDDPDVLDLAAERIRRRQAGSRNRHRDSGGT